MLPCRLVIMNTYEKLTTYNFCILRLTGNDVANHLKV